MIAPVVEVSDATEGVTELKVRDSHGARIGFFQVDSGCMDDELVAALKDWQYRHAHEGLHLMLPDASSA